MSKLILDLPEAILEQVEAQAAQSGLTLREYVLVSLTERVTADQAAAYFRRRGERADAAAFSDALARVPDVEPIEEDRLP